MGVERPLRPWGLAALALFLFGDLIFILIQIRLALAGQLHHNAFDLGHEGGVPEWFNYSKWAIGGIACLYAYERRREPLYFAWAVLLLYLLIDNSSELHEHIGRALRDGLSLQPGFLGRGQNLGEALAAALIITSLFVIMTLAYLLNGSGSARSFTWRMTPWLVLLFISGVCFDIAGDKLMPILSAVAGVNVPSVTRSIIEDGGEMIAASFLAVTAIAQAAAYFARQTAVIDGALNPTSYLSPQPVSLRPWR